MCGKDHRMTTKRVYVDRSRNLDADRCMRLRWIAYHAGSAQLGVQPVRKSIHLVLGGAVHSGLEVLLRESSEWLNFNPSLGVEGLFRVQTFGDQLLVRAIENDAVAAALADLSKMTLHGVELDENEKPDPRDATTTTGSPSVASGSGSRPVGLASQVAESPMVIDFGEFDAATGKFIDAIENSVKDDPGGYMESGSTPVGEPGFFAQKYQDSPQGAASPAMATSAGPEVLGVEGGMGLSLRTNPLDTVPIKFDGLMADSDTPPADWSTPIYSGMTRAADVSAALALDTRLDEIEIANAQAATGMDDYLKQELAAQVEGMVRAYARRRLKPLLEEFEVLEVEREGEWKLGEFEEEGKGEEEWWCRTCGWVGPKPLIRNNNEFCPECTSISNHAYAYSRLKYHKSEIYFMSRLDALLLNRQTNSLYLQSYKTTGQWDRRKEAEAQIDMQGLTESVDVDNRLAQAWQELMVPAGKDRMEIDWGYVNTRVDPNVIQWLRTLPEPPRILGVRYEYLIKGPRRQDSKDIAMPGRYVADTPLIRAYMQEGITGDDRKWAANYQIWINGKQRNLDYRSYRKQPVWKFTPIAKWIDMLDRGEVQPEACDKNGYPIDVLADQFVTPLTVYRNEDDLRDMIQQLEYQEIRIAQNVAKVHAAANESEKRELLNQYFPQNRRSCVYPGLCGCYNVCYGSSDMKKNPEGSGLYQIRTPNHPQELVAYTPE
jgi:hypothetical protein